jgi:hypothetical protein
VLARKRFQALMVALAAAAPLLVLPVAAHASPRWFINDRLAGVKHEGLVSYGEVALENNQLGKISCQTIAAGSFWNESEKGFGPTEGFTTYDCTTEPSPCPGAFVTAERPVKVVKRIEKEGLKETVKYEGVHESGTLPWSGEAIAEEGGERLRKIRTHGILMTLVMPCLNLEVPFEGALEPIATNGTKNGLNPSHLTFQPKGGKTGFLATTKLGTSEEDRNGYVIGELTDIGASGLELVTAE